MTFQGPGYFFPSLSSPECGPGFIQQSRSDLSTLGLIIAPHGEGVKSLKTWGMTVGKCDVLLIDVRIIDRTYVRSMDLTPCRLRRGQWAS
jgi:hypothetical protein